MSKAVSPVEMVIRIFREATEDEAKVLLGAAKETLAGKNPPALAAPKPRKARADKGRQREPKAQETAAKE